MSAVMKVNIKVMNSLVLFAQKTSCLSMFLKWYLIILDEKKVI